MPNPGTLAEIASYTELNEFLKRCAKLAPQRDEIAIDQRRSPQILSPKRYLSLLPVVRLNTV
jgi:hypothetical protein